MKLINTKSAARSIKAVVLASALAATGMAHAVTGSLAVGGTLTELGWTVSDLNGTGKLVFSTTLLGALNAGGIEITKIDPALLSVTTNTRGGYTAVSAAAPVQSLSGSFDGSILSISTVSTLGGAKLVSTADGFTNTGGSLSINNLQVDVSTKKVYADIIGGNGVGAINHFELWDVATLTGPTSFAAVAGVTTSVNSLSGLTINANAFSKFSQSLGLTTAGVSALQTITDYGSVTSTISVKATQAVPEPSTYALMGVGLLAIAGVTRSRRQRNAA